MTCKDCIHYDVCSWFGNIFTEEMADECLRFDDKSRFVELPCNNNDTVYVVYDDGRISKEEVNHFTIYEDGIGISTDRLCDGTWGEDIFPTREEAKKHLKG